MRLYLIRHAIAVEAAEFPGPDLDRPLTEEGRRRARKAFGGLAVFATRPALILSSEANRARETAEIVADELGGEIRIDARLNPGADYETVCTILEGLGPELEAVAIVGHEPDLSDIASGLLHSDPANSSFLHLGIKKAGVIELELFSSRSGELLSFLPPRLLRRLRA